MRRTFAFAVAVLALTSWACVAAPPEERRDPPSRDDFGTAVRAEPAVFRPPQGRITLDDALQAALQASPRLAAADAELLARAAEIEQAGLIPNPELEAEIEDFGGTNGFRGFDDSEGSLGVSQLFELGGKRSRRRDAAALARDLARWDYEGARRDVRLDTTVAYYGVVAAERRTALAEEAARLADETLRAISERVEAGSAAPPEADRARVLAATRRIELDLARRAAAAAKRDLAAQWGADDVGFEAAETELEPDAAVPPLDLLLPRLAGNPDLARWDAEMDLLWAELAVEEAEATPDLVGSAAVKRFFGAGETAFAAGVGIELPLFDRNQGAIRAARHRLAKAAAERRAAETAARAALGNAHERLDGAWRSATAIREELLPAAERAFAATEEAYRQGRAGYLEVLDAQGELVEARLAFVDAVESFHQSRAEVERLAGKFGESTGGGK